MNFFHPVNTHRHNYAKSYFSFIRKTRKRRSIEKLKGTASHLKNIAYFKSGQKYLSCLLYQGEV
jgi:hypothetical protein